MYLDEQKADGLYQAAVLANNYSLTNKQSFLRGEQQMPSSLVKDNISDSILMLTLLHCYCVFLKY